LFEEQLAFEEKERLIDGNITARLIYYSAPPFDKSMRGLMLNNLSLLGSFKSFSSLLLKCRYLRIATNLSLRIVSPNIGE